MQFRYKKKHRQFVTLPGDKSYPPVLPNPYFIEIRALSSYIVTIPVILIASYLFFNLADGDMVIAWGKEDSFFEWLTAIFYFAGAVLLLLSFKKNRNILLLLLSLVLFFGAGEEISWGQRVFGFATPEEINKINVQHEFNIHNMILFDGKTMDGGLKSGLSRIFEMDMLFKLFTIVWGALLPLCVYHVASIARLVKKYKVPVPPISTGIFFLISWIALKLSLAAMGSLPAGASVESYRHYWRIYMAGPEIAEFVSAYILAITCLYFFNYRNRHIMGRDFKQLKRSRAV